MLCQRVSQADLGLIHRCRMGHDLREPLHDPEERRGVGVALPHVQDSQADGVSARQLT